MHVLLLTTSFPLTAASSSGIFVERLASRLGSLCQLRVLTPASTFPAQLHEQKPYTLSTFTYAPSKWQILAHRGGGIPAALSNKPWLWLLLPVFLVSMTISCFRQAGHADIIFANWSICGVIAGIVGLIRRRPVVTTFRGSDVNRVNSSLFHRLLIKLCMHMSAAVVAVSDDIEKRLLNMYPAMTKNIYMIPNGVDITEGQTTTSDNADKNSIRLLMVGNLIPGKSVDTALYALKDLPKEFTLTIVGDGPERPRLESLSTQLGLNERVKLVGHVAPAQVPDWLKISDIFIMTSRSEGRPNALLEAMAAGLPVVGSDIPGIRELITGDITGKIFPVGNSAGLVTALHQLRDRSRRQSLGEAARDSILVRGLSWENTAKRYLQQFEKIVAGSRS